MKIVTKRVSIDSAAERIKLQYCHKGKWKDYPWNPQKRYERLIELPREATEEQVIEIIGNNSWTSNMCDECDTDSEITVILGEPTNYEGHTARICPNCLLLAIQLIDKMSI